jgi:hypothetical protein
MQGMFRRRANLVANLTASLVGVAVLAVGLAGCADPGRPPPPSASLPERSGAGAADPTRSAILASSYAFNHPQSLQGRPAEAAEALAQLEYLAVEIPTGGRYRSFNPLTGQELVAARDEARRALGISPAAAPQSVIDSLSAAAAGLRRGDRAGAEASLAPVAVPETGGAGLASRLAALPPLPRAGWATARAEQSLRETDQDDNRRFRFFR